MGKREDKGELSILLVTAMLVAIAVILCNVMETPLTDSVTVTLPNQVSTPVEKDGTVNINTASIQQLCELPHVGEAIAQRIIEYRETYGAFERIEELLNVKGIGASYLEEMKPKIRLQE